MGGGRWWTCWPPPKLTAAAPAPARSWSSGFRTGRSPSSRASCRSPRSGSTRISLPVGHRLLLILRDLVRATVGRGQIALFHVLEIGGARIALRLSQLSAARAAYRVAVPSIESWGATTVPSVAALSIPFRARKAASPSSNRCWSTCPAFRWIESEQPLVLVYRPSQPPPRRPRRVLSVTSRLPIARLWGALFHARPGGAPAPETLDRICREIPGARIVASELIFDGRLDRSVYLTETENRLVTTSRLRVGACPSPSSAGSSSPWGCPGRPPLVRCERRLSSRRPRTVSCACSEATAAISGRSPRSVQ